KIELEPSFQRQIIQEIEKLRKSIEELRIEKQENERKLLEQGRGTSSSDLQEKKLRTQDRGLNEVHLKLYRNEVVLSEVVSRLYQSAKYAEAVPLAKRLVENIKEEYGDTHPRHAKSLEMLAQLYRADGRLADAESLYRQALNSLELYENVLGPHNSGVGTVLVNLGGP